MNRAFAVLAGIASATGACKKPRDPGLSTPAERMQMFAVRMCQCAEPSCADRVQQELTDWSTEEAKRASRTAHHPTQAEMTVISEAATRYGECLSKAMAGPPVAPIADPVSRELPPPPPRDKPIAIEPQLRAVREATTALSEHYVLSSIKVSYARADGTLDPTYGKLEVYYTRTSAEPADDPKRPIGAPVPPKPPAAAPETCPAWTLEQGPWVRSLTSCIFGFPTLTAPRCSVAQIWTRALADKAPAAALASLALEHADAQQWVFTISDPPRGIDIRLAYPDDCEPQLEK